MISGRCNGLNLLNHCKQVNSPSNLNIEYKIIDEVIKKWECVLCYDIDGAHKSESVVGLTKIGCLKELINKVEVDLKKGLKIKCK